MPETASATAIRRLGLKVCNESNNCSIVLKEVGKKEGSRAVYEVQAKKQGKFLGIFKIKADVSTQIDSETGNVVSSKKPWWSFLVAGV